MSREELRQKLKAVRQKSLWPTTESFAFQVGLSPGGYRKLEEGTRLPSSETLTNIMERARFTPEERTELWRLWNQAKGDEVGVVVADPKPPIDRARMASRLLSEVVYVLRQEGINLNEKTERVLFNRIQMLLSAAE